MDKIIKCKNCIFFNKDKSHPFNNKLKLCLNKHFGEYSYMKKDIRNKDNILLYEYEEGGNFYSGKNFGCIHGKKRGNK